MKKSQLRHIIRQVIREQRDDFDFEDFEREREPQAMPPPGGKRAVFDYACGWHVGMPSCPSITGTGAPFTSGNVVKVLDNGVWRDPLVGDIVKPVGWDSCTMSGCCNGGNGPECNIMKFVVTSLIQTNYTGPISDNYELTNCTPNCLGTNSCANFDNSICQECMNPGGPSQPYLQGMVNYQNYNAGHTFWHMLANPGRSYGAYYHQIVHSGGGCDCCHDSNANPCQSQGCNTPPSDWNQPFNSPMTPVCLAPNDPQYQVGYPCDCHLNNTPC